MPTSMEVGLSGASTRTRSRAPRVGHVRGDDSGHVAIVMFMATLGMDEVAGVAIGGVQR